MKTKILLFLAILPLIYSCSGTSTPPFSYSDNTRIVIEGELLNSNYAVLPNQLVQLYALNGGNSAVMIHQTVSDSNGKFYISSPRGNYNLYVVFPEKNVSTTGNNSNLIKQFQWKGLGYLSGSYYDFRKIVLL